MWPRTPGRDWSGVVAEGPSDLIGREVGVRFRGVGVAHLRHIGWQLFRPATYVNWCGHGQEVIPFPLADGRVTFVPVLGEAR